MMLQKFAGLASKTRIKLRLVVWISAGIMGLSSVVYGWEWVAFLGLIGWFYYVDHARKLSRRQILIDCYIGIFIICAFAFLYLLQAEVQNWNVSFHGWFAVVAQALSWLLVCSFCALSGLLLGYLLSRFRHVRGSLLLFAIAWPLAELVRSYLFVVMSYGSGGSLSPNFNMGSVAVAASGTHLVYAARLGGFMGLGLLCAALCLAVYLILLKRRFGFGLIIIVLVLGIVAFGYQVPAPSVVDNSSTHKVVTVHLNEQDDMAKWNDFSEIPSGVDLLVLPEYSGALDNPNFKDLAAKLSNQGVGVTTIDKGRPPQATNQLIFFNRDGRIISAQDKTLLIPTGEYLPYSLIASFYAIGQQANITNFTYTQKLIPGAAPIKPVTQGSITVGALACSGILSFSDYSSLAASGANVLVNTASLSFLEANSRYHVFARNMARYQAVVTNRPFVQASRSGHSFVINRQGRYLSTSHDQDSQVQTILVGGVGR